MLFEMSCSETPTVVCKCGMLMGYTIYPFGVTEVKPENFDGDLFNAFSPETSALLKGLGDSPESLQLKAEYMQSINKLRRGRLY